MPGKGANAYDLIVIGAGINGAGIARDAAGRGLKVLAVEKDDIAAATSQWSTKLIHGGLRYLEYYEFRLVRESLSEREVVLRQAPHLVQPLQFVLPHEPHLRPAWMIRAGLFMYDHLSQRTTLPGSFSVGLQGSKWGAGLKPNFERGFVYADAQVDDARLVLANAMSAREHGADIRVHTKLVSARREGGVWRATLEAPGGVRSEVEGRVIANAGGPWVKAIRDTLGTTPSPDNVRHVKGSHIVVPRVHAESHAYILQNRDNRIVFVIPFDDRYSLIGTTDIAVSDYEHPKISVDETRYLLELANTYLASPLTASDVVWAFSGVRPLYDDGQSDPSAITRDYVLKLDDGGAPLVSVYGGKITTYRRLAEHVLQELRPFLPSMRPAWTSGAALPGGDLPQGGIEAWTQELGRRYPALPGDVVRGVARRHGSLATAVLDNARTPVDLGTDFGNGLSAREVDYMVRAEWAHTADDVLWRRSKCGLGMTEAARARRGLCNASRAGRSVSVNAANTMRPLAAMPPEVRAGIRGVLLDIDDTLTTGGQLTADAYAALDALSRAGRLVIPITGRPAGWCDHIARMWPVAAVVGENGAFYMRYDRIAQRLDRRFVIDDVTRRDNRARLAAIGEHILRSVPGAGLASDQHYRETDLAIDYREDVRELPRAAVDRIVALMEAEGMTAKVSSIHVNGWFGAWDKLATTKLLFAEALDVDLDRERARYVFAGDSPNDAPMFAYFPNAVGVANVRVFADRIAALPAYVTAAESGTGFAELVAFLLQPA